MRDSDLQKVGLVISAMVWLIAMKLPEAAIGIVMLWAGILVIDSIENRGKSNMVMFKGRI